MAGFEEGGVKQNLIRGGNIVFLASLHNNDATMSQFHALTMLSESFIKSLTIVLPFFPTATMERITREGEVATAVQRLSLLIALYKFLCISNHLYASDLAASLCRSVAAGWVCRIR